jgi:hypothetical protein
MPSVLGDKGALLAPRDAGAQQTEKVRRVAAGTRRREAIAISFPP